MHLRQDLVDPDFSDSLQHHPFPNTPNYSDDAIDDCFMSGQTFQFHDPFWASNVPLFGGQTQQQPQLPALQQQNFLNNSSDFYPQQNSAAQHSREWQLYGDGIFNQGLHLSPQNRLNRQHRRALSNSTATSQASTSSPLQYPATYDGSLLEAYSQQSAYQNYPTPSQTPTQDSFMDRRNRTNQDLTAKGNRGSLNQLTSDPNQAVSNQIFDYPATPKTANGDFNDRQVKGGPNGETQSQTHSAWHNDDSLFTDDLVTRPVPNLDRTISDVFQDELYNPPQAGGSQPQQQQQQPQAMNHSSVMLSPHHSVMSDRLQAAYKARSSNSPINLKREASPFRPDSPYAMSNNGFGQMAAGPVGTAAGQRRQQKAEADAHAYQQHHMIPDDLAPKTISPQEAYLDDFHDPAEDSSVPLFHPNAAGPQHLFDTGASRNSYGPMSGNGQVGHPNFNFQAAAMPTMVPKRSPSSADFAQNRSHGESNEDEPADFPAHLISMETSKSEPDPESSQESEIERPTGTTADSGSYTCTYRNCSQRFNSPALLQRHKREAHRATGSSTTKSEPRSPKSSSGVDSDASPARNSQAGPHRCDRINPSTGKPCNTVFSRPYDLTRHEDTIHARRGKVQCQYCNEEKTFSRADALTRHMRVVHPTIEFPGKHRRRHGD